MPDRPRFRIDTTPPIGGVLRSGLGLLGLGGGAAIYIARNRESPIGLDREDFHAAQISAAMGGGKVIDLMPRWGEAVGDDADAALDRLMGG